ncbi:hypothetical protein L6452_17906 [Arctium lappa]|uniref:Uncharacterized protein n=1 Tax=Arctium lappa TaxID=4217 RepID=A0ACB9C4U0_ARCLA|nr:hypothetical protein L6452_17906 [Arctium lappa]
MDKSVEKSNIIFFHSHIKRDQLSSSLVVHKDSRQKGWKSLRQGGYWEACCLSKTRLQNQRRSFGRFLIRLKNHCNCSEDFICSGCSCMVSL